MNYRKVYMAIIRHAQKHQEERKFWKDIKSLSNISVRKGNSIFIHGCYYEKHHILPKSLFPNWIIKKENIVLLTAKEHFFCHQLLIKIFKSDSMIYALWNMNNINGKKLNNSKIYENLKIKMSEIMSNTKLNKDKVASLELREFRREKILGKFWFNNGTQQKQLFEAPIGWVPGQIKKDYSIVQHPNKGKQNKYKGKHYNITDERRKEISVIHTGYKHSDTAKEKNRIESSSRKWYNDGIVNIFSKEQPAGWNKGRIKKIIPKEIEDLINNGFFANSINDIFLKIDEVNISTGYQRKIKVSFFCSKCGNLIKLPMHKFSIYGRKNFICVNCINRERMILNNPTKRKL